MVNVTIYGSCVSRDVFRFEHQGLHLDAYYARSSWISAANDAVTHPSAESRLASKFQQRMVDIDFSSGILPRLRDVASDVVVLDLIDERAGVIPVGSNGFVTYLSEQKQSGWLPHIKHGRVIRLGSERHLELFTKAAEKVRDAVGDTPAMVLKSDFAANSVEGVEIPQALGQNARYWNDAYVPYFDVLERLGFTIVQAPSELCVTTTNHQWGPAQYHYIDDFYHWAAETIKNLPR